MDNSVFQTGRAQDAAGSSRARRGRTVVLLRSVRRFATGSNMNLWRHSPWRVVCRPCVRRPPVLVRPSLPAPPQSGTGRLALGQFFGLLTATVNHRNSAVARARSGSLQARINVVRDSRCARGADEIRTGTPTGMRKYR